MWYQFSVWRGSNPFCCAKCKNTSLQFLISWNRSCFVPDGNAHVSDMFQERMRKGVGEGFTPLRKVCFWECFLDNPFESSLLLHHRAATLHISSIVRNEVVFFRKKKGKMNGNQTWLMTSVQPRESQERRSRGSNPRSFAISSRKLLQLWMSNQYFFGGRRRCCCVVPSFSLKMG